MNIIDPHSFAKNNDAIVTHLNWNATVDFNSKIISAEAEWTIENKTGTDKIIFDTRDLQIEKVILNHKNETAFKIYCIFI